MASEAAPSVSAMDDSTQQTHIGQVRRVLELLAEAGDHAALIAESLSEDGAQPHLIAALSSVENDLRAQQIRLARSTVDQPVEDQQRLTV